MKKYIYLLIITFMVSFMASFGTASCAPSTEPDKTATESDDNKKEKSNNKNDEKQKSQDDDDKSENKKDNTKEKDDNKDDSENNDKDDEDKDEEDEEEVYMPASRQMLAVDLNNDLILFNQNEDEIINPGSLVKIATAITAIDLCKGEIKKKVTVPDDALENYSRSDGNVGLLAGEVLTIEELIECMLLADAGDCAFALARITAKSYDEFIDAMNETAKNAGAEKTVFTDPTGCESENQKTTLSDMYLITKYALQNEKFASIVKTNGIEIAANKTYNKKRYIFNTNQFVCKYYSDMHYNPYMEGVKGYVNSDDDCGMIAKYTVGNTNLLLLCSESYIEDNLNYSYNDIEYLIEYVNETYTETVIVKKEEFIHEVKLNNAKDTNRILLASSNATRALLPLYYDRNKITKEITVDDNITAPIKKGEVLGKMVVYYDGTKCGESDLVAYNDVESSMTEYLKQKIDTLISSWYFKTAVAVCISAFVILTVIRNVNKKKSKKKK